MRNSEVLNLFGIDIWHNGKPGGYVGWSISYGYYFIFVSGFADYDHTIEIYYCGSPFNTDKMSKLEHIENIHKISYNSSPKEVAERVATILTWCISKNELENEKLKYWSFRNCVWYK